MQCDGRHVLPVSLQLENITVYPSASVCCALRCSTVGMSDREEDELQIAVCEKIATAALLQL